MIKFAPPLLAFAFFFIFSCSSDEVKSSYNYIEKFEIEGISPIEIDISNDIIYIRTFPENRESLLSKTPEIKTSEKATLSDNGLNWAAEGFKYTVIAENGDARDYYVEIITVPFPKKYSFETWKLSNGTYVYQIPSGENLGWSSGNVGIAVALSMLGKDSKNPEIYPTKNTAQGYSGNAVLMETIEGGMVYGMNISLISGNFFLGNFNASKSITPLAATELGRTYPAKPKTIKGYYKYAQGQGVFQSEGVPEPGRLDSCNMSIRFYQSDLPGARDTTLTVENIDDSPLVIGQVTNPEDGCSDTGEEFKEFNLELDYASEPDFENHRYKLAITFAASRNGDKYAGKIGSKLIVDEIEIEDY